MTGHGLSKCTRYATNGTNDDGPAKPAQWHGNSNGSVPYNTTLAVMKLDDEASCNGSLPGQITDGLNAAHGEGRRTHQLN